MKTRKVVINACYGGFGLSPKAMARWAELNGKGCHFFIQDIAHGSRSKYIAVTMDEAASAFMYYAFTIPNPNELLNPTVDWLALSVDERRAHSEIFNRYHLNDGYIPRDDPSLVQVVEEMGSEVASDRLANLKVIEIPDDVQWEIDEYDGYESIHEVHRSWS